MPYSSSDIGYTKLIEMDKKANPNLPPIPSKACMPHLRHQKWVRKELEELEKAGIFQRSLSLYACQIVIALRKCPQGSLMQETK